MSEAEERLRVRLQTDLRRALKELRSLIAALDNAGAVAIPGRGIRFPVNQRKFCAVDSMELRWASCKRANSQSGSTPL
jgi:hypothetical protein